MGRYHLFLSRLCGGEGKPITASMANGFLSRLCGGEVNCINYARGVKFLSRLCGGEESNKAMAAML